MAIPRSAEKMPLILWCTPTEYATLVEALSSDSSFHDALRRVVLAHVNKGAATLFTLVPEDASRIIEDLNLEGFEDASDLVEVMRQQLEMALRNERIVSRRFALPQVSSFEG